MPEPQQFCSFHLDGLLFGVEVMRVQEVIRYQHVTRVPLAPAVIRGLINLRGQIVTAVDLRLRLELGERAPDVSPMSVVVRTDEGPVTLLVDDIGDVLEVSDESFAPPPESLAGAARDLIRGAYKLKNRLLLLLDVDRAVHPNADHPECAPSVTAARPNLN
jgi:purine-binding chemotaxis protein CheW